MNRLPLFLLCTISLWVCLVGPLWAADPPLRLLISGVSGELHEVLEKALQPPAGLVTGTQVNRRWLRRYARQVPEVVRGALQPLGYFHSRVEARIEERAGGGTDLVVEVAAGEPLRITDRQVEIEAPGDVPPALQRQLEEFPLPVGAILDQPRYEEAKGTLKTRAVQLGYLDADFSRRELRVHRGERSVELLLTLQTGPRYRFGETRIAGSEYYPPGFIERYLAYRPGEVFLQTRLAETRAQLLDSDLFRSISVVPRPEAAEELSVPVEIEVQPAPRHQLRPGIGYGTDTGARLSLRYRHLNLFQLGHELQGDLLIAERRQSLVSNYIIPDSDELNSQTSIRVGYDREDIETYQSQSLFTEVERQKVLTPHLIGSVFLRLSQESSDIAGEEIDSRLLLPGVRLTYRKLDRLKAPREAWQGRLELLGGSEQLLSDTSLVQLSGDLSRRQPLTDRLSLLLRLTGGASFLEESFSSLPVSLRFFAGGDRSVRGYRYQSLGPTNEEGEVIGGKHLLAATVELERRLSENWGVAIFYDAGNAFDTFSDYELEQGAGLGVRRYTQIGPIRLDLARRLGNPKVKYRLHLSVGFGW